MLVKTPLCGLVVIRPHGENAVRAEALRAFGCLHGLLCRVAAGAENHRNALLRLIQDDTEDTVRLIAFQRRAFACCPAGQKHVHAPGDLKVHKAPQRRLIDGAVGGKRGHHCGARTLK